MKKRKTKAEIVAEKGEDWYYEHVYLPWKIAHEKRQQDPEYQHKRYLASYACRKRKFESDPEYKKSYIKKQSGTVKSHKQRWKSYCVEYWKIENYEKAKADNFKGWHCHHRLELHPDGSLRFTSEALQRLGLYENRPPRELIFIRRSEHSKLHGKNRHTNG